MYNRPRMSMTTHRESKKIPYSGYHKAGMWSYRIRWRKLLFLDLGSDTNYVIKLLTISCTKPTKKSRCMNLEQPRSTSCEKSLLCCAAILLLCCVLHINKFKRLFKLRQERISIHSLSATKISIKASSRLSMKMHCKYVKINLNFMSASKKNMYVTKK